MSSNLFYILIILIMLLIASSTLQWTLNAAWHVESDHYGMDSFTVPCLGDISGMSLRRLAMPPCNRTVLTSRERRAACSQGRGSGEPPSECAIVLGAGNQPSSKQMPRINHANRISKVIYEVLMPAAARSLLFMHRCRSCHAHFIQRRSTA